MTNSGSHSLAKVWARFEMPLELMHDFTIPPARTITGLQSRISAVPSTLLWPQYARAITWHFQTPLVASGQTMPELDRPVPHLSRTVTIVHRWASPTKILVPLILIRYFMNLVPLTASPLT